MHCSIYLQWPFPKVLKFKLRIMKQKKITEELKFTSQKIDACPNNCMLFRGEDSIPKTAVSKGVLVSKYPEVKVDNVPLGRDDSKIFVTDAIYPNYEFRRSGSKKALKLGQMVGKCVAWPKSNVMDIMSVPGNVATSI
ncbi:hypothetical protein LIER_20953 [Lithospermum erythrorhizon]|uniref:Transposase n=1 Tax=Lithospermum erythrorhizon TaxID=34254 RepID=A0AAV3QRJ3_LITER